MIVGLYVPGQSFAHRLGAGPKMSLLFAAGVGLVFVDSVIVLSAIVIATSVLFIKGADLSPTHLWKTTRPLLIWFAFIVLAQMMLAEGSAAARIVLRLTALVWLAALLTYTTRLSDMTALLVKVCSVLRPLGVSPSRVAFMIALTLRLIPALGDVVSEVREAQRARGLERSFVAAIVPTLIRIFRQADAMSDALVARGYDRWDEAS